MRTPASATMLTVLILAAMIAPNSACLKFIWSLIQPTSEPNPTDTTDADNCASNPCWNQGTCVDGDNSYQCICSHGWEGTHCTEISCKPNPCRNGGVCNRFIPPDGQIYIQCSCPFGVSGVNCEITTTTSTTLAPTTTRTVVPNTERCNSRLNNQCYKAYSVPKSWQDAYNACLAEGAMLASPRSPAENSLLQGLLFDNGGGMAWLNAQDSANESTWVWQDNMEVVTWNNWPPGMPTRSTWKNCLTIASNALWTAANCGEYTLFPYTCVKSTSPDCRKDSGDIALLSPTGRSKGGVASSQLDVDEDISYMNSTYTRECYERVADAHCIQAAVIAAMALRESRGGKLLESTDGYGDYRKGRYNAWGVMQCDMFTSGMNCTQYGWNSCDHIEMMVRDKVIPDIAAVSRKHPTWTKEQKLQGAVAAYNFGVSNVQTWPGLDEGSSGGDYSNDVIARAQYLQSEYGWN